MEDSTFEKTLRRISDALTTTGAPPKDIYFVWLTPQVAWGYMRLRESGQALHTVEYPDMFYFIGNDAEIQAGVYIHAGSPGAWQHDLHVFVLPEHRKQRIVGPQLSVVILPHLCAQQICQYEGGARVLTSTDSTREFTVRSERMLVKAGFVRTAVHGNESAWRFTSARSEFPIPHKTPSKESVTTSFVEGLSRFEHWLDACAEMFPRTKTEKREMLRAQALRIAEIADIQPRNPTDNHADQVNLPRNDTFAAESLRYVDRLIWDGAKLELHLAGSIDTEIVDEFVWELKDFRINAIDLVEDYRYTLNPAAH